MTTIGTETITKYVLVFRWFVAVNVETYSLADLTKLMGEGAKRRTVQLWAEAGVIQADPDTERAGAGTHRRFSKDEAIIACIIRAFASAGMNIGSLLRFSKALRLLLDRKGVRANIAAAIADDGRVFLKVLSTPKQIVDCEIVRNAGDDDNRFIQEYPSAPDAPAEAIMHFVFLNPYLRHLG